MPANHAIVLAAGKGTRMKSDLPKVLIPIAGRPMIRHVVDALRAGGIEEITVVVGYRADLVRQELADEPGLDFVDQTEQLGTGHAVMMCRDRLQGRDGGVLVVTGDAPLLQPRSVAALRGIYADESLACLLGTVHKDDPHGLGRIVRGPDGRFQAIVEERDAKPEQRRITEVNMSCYVFRSPDLLFALDHLRAENAQREYYLTDCPAILLRAGRPIDARPVLDPIEALGVNTPEELLRAERALLALSGK